MQTQNLNASERKEPDKAFTEFSLNCITAVEYFPTKALGSAPGTLEQNTIAPYRDSLV